MHTWPSAVRLAVNEFGWMLVSFVISARFSRHAATSIMIGGTRGHLVDGFPEYICLSVLGFVGETGLLFCIGRF